MSYQLTNLLGFVCVMVATPYYKEQPVGEWFVFVSMTGFWVSSVLLVMYLVHAMEKFHVIPWLMIEFGFCGLWTFFYFSSALAAAVEVSTGCHVVLPEKHFGLHADSTIALHCWL